MEPRADMSRVMSGVRRRTSILKVNHQTEPLRAGSVFVVQGHVYQVYEDKSQGRHLVRHMGVAGINNLPKEVETHL